MSLRGLSFHIVATAGLLGAMLLAAAAAAAMSSEEIGVQVKRCQRDFPKVRESRSQCVSDIYEGTGMLELLKANSNCFAKKATFLNIDNCESARKKLPNTALGTNPIGVSANGSNPPLTLQGEGVPNGLPSMPRQESAEQAAAQNKSVSPSTVGAATSSSSLGGIALWVAAGFGLLIVAGTFFLLRRSHDSDFAVIELKMAEGAKEQNQKLLALSDKVKKLSEALESTRSTLEEFRDGWVADRNKQYEAARAANARASSGAVHAQAAPRASSLNGEAFQNALTDAFRSLANRNSPLPPGREYERLLASIEDAQVKAVVDSRGPNACRLLDGNGVENTFNPTLFAIRLTTGEWLVYPIPCAERSAIYRHWFDGFDESRSMIARLPATGRDAGGSIQPISKGRLA